MHFSASFIAAIYIEIMQGDDVVEPKKKKNFEKKHIRRRVIAPPLDVFCFCCANRQNLNKNVATIFAAGAEKILYNASTSKDICTQYAYTYIYIYTYSCTRLYMYVAGRILLYFSALYAIFLCISLVYYFLFYFFTFASFFS